MSISLPSRSSEVETRFAALVSQCGGNILKAAARDRALYSEYRKSIDGATQPAAGKTHLGVPQANHVSGTKISRAVIFFAGQDSPAGDGRIITREDIVQLRHRLGQKASVQIFDGRGEEFSNLIGKASNFRVCDSQLCADVELISSHPVAAQIADATTRNPASVAYTLTGQGDALMVNVLEGTQLSKRGKSITRFAALHPEDYGAARKAGRI